jgi:hypothetical protein
MQLRLGLLLEYLRRGHSLVRFERREMLRRGRELHDLDRVLQSRVRRRHMLGIGVRRGRPSMLVGRGML